MYKPGLRLLLLVAALIASQSAAWSQVPMMVGDYSYCDGPLQGDPSVTHVTSIKPPVRPTTALEITRYLFARYPVVRSDDGPRYEIKVFPGRFVGIPYNLSEAEALNRLQVYYNHPLPGLPSSEIGSLLDLLKPEPKVTERVVAEADPGSDGPGAPRYTVKVEVQSAKISDPNNFGILTPVLDESASGDDIANLATNSQLTIPSAAKDYSTAVRPESVVGKVHNRLIPFTRQRTGTAWCLNQQCDLMVTNYHVAQFLGDDVVVNGEAVVKTWIATGPDDVNLREMQLYGKTYRLNLVRDLAILQMRNPLSRKGMHSVPLFPGKLRAGDPVTILSYPKGKLAVTAGRFQAVMEHGVLKFDLKSELAPGCSGGLVLNSQQQAVGVLFGLDPSGRAVFVIPMWSLAEFVKKTDPSLYTQLFPLTPQRSETGTQRVESQVTIFDASGAAANEDDSR